MMKEFKNMQKETKGNELWCTKCKIDGHMRGSCLKNQFYDICQIMGDSTKECPFNMKTRGHQQVLLTQEAFTLGGVGNMNNDGNTIFIFFLNSKCSPSMNHHFFSPPVGLLSILFINSFGFLAYTRIVSFFPCFVV